MLLAESAGVRIDDEIADQAPAVMQSARTVRSCIRRGSVRRSVVILGSQPTCGSGGVCIEQRERADKAYRFYR
jgi:hypothetical protein